MQFVHPYSARKEKNVSNFKRPLRIDGAVAYVPLSRGYEAIIDSEDALLIGGENWCVTGPGLQTGDGGCIYAMRIDTKTGRRVNLRMHRVILDAPEHLQVDHINGNGLDNRKSNLRLVTPAQNIQNQRKAKDNTSGYKGVSWDKRLSRWRAIISANGKSKYLGSFDHAAAAHQAYVEASKIYHGKYGRVT